MSPRFNPALARPLGIAAVALVSASSLNLQAAVAEEAAPETPTLATAEKNTERTPLENDQVLVDAVKKAEEAGVKVTQGETKTVDASITTLEAAVKDANADYEQQARDLEAAIKLQESYDAEYAGAVSSRNIIIEQNKTIDADNANAKAAHDAAVEAQKQVEEANKAIEAQRAEITASNDKGLKDALAAHDDYVEALKVWQERTQAIIDANNATNEQNRQRLDAVSQAVSSATTDADRDKAATEFNKVVAEILADNAKVNDENRAKMEAYNAELKTALEKRDAALAQLEAVRAGNAEKRAAFQAAVEKYEADVATYNTKAQAYTDLINALENGGTVVTQDFLDQCRTQNLAVVIDLTYSFATNDYNKQFDAYRQFLTQMSQLPGTTVDIYFYGNGGAQNNDGVLYDTPLADQNFDISTPEGLAGALDVLNRAGSVDRGTDEHHNWFSSGTNWEGGLRQVLQGMQDTGRNYTNVLFTSDGAPNKYENENGEWVDTGTSGYDRTAADEALGVAREILDGDTRITPVFIRTTEEPNISIMALEAAEPGTLQKALDAIGSLSGATNPVLGEDYYSAENMDGLVGDLWKAAIADCKPTNNSKPTPPTEPEYDPEDVVVPELPDAPELKDADDVAPLTTPPTEPADFIPAPLPDFLPIPPVPEYNPAPKLTVPDEPVKKQAEAQYNLIDVRLQEADLKVAKTILDNDASDGSISFRIDGGNAGAITAADVLTTDLKGEGIVSIELSEALYNGEKVDDNKLRLDGDKAVLKNVAPGDTYSFVVTAEVDPNADVVTNGVKTTSPDDPDAGNPEDPQRNDGLEDDTDGWDEETTPVRNTSEQKLNKKFISFDEETGKATYEIEVENSRALAKNVVLTDVGGEGLSNPVITKAEVIQGDATHVVDVANGTESASDATGAPVDEATAEPTAEATESAQAQDFTHTVSLLPGATTSVSIFGSADEAKGAKVELGTPTGAISASWKGADVIDITAKENASGTITLPYTIIKDGVTVEETIGVTVEAPTGDTAPVVAPATEVSAEVSAEPTADASAEAPVAEETFVAPAASEQDALAATDPTVLDDIRVEGATATVDAMAVGERLVVTVEADVADTARLIDNAAFVTSDNGTDGKDGSQTNEDVPSDTDGWDKETNELDRPADLRVNKEVVDGDASDHKVSFRITGANVGVGDSPETVIADMTEHRVGLENPVITEVKLGEGELAAERYIVAESGDAITVDDLKAGEEVSYLIEFDVIAGATEITNAASVTSPKSPVDPNGEIQENEDIPGDNDQKDKVSVDPVAPDLKVLKEVVDGDASDGKLSFKVSGANLGTANAPETRITDELAQGLKNPVISEVSEGATIIEEEGVTGILVDDLTVGAEASFVVEFDVEPGVTEVYNAAYIDSPYAPVDTEGDIQDNNDLPGDEDQRDGVSLTADPNLKVDKEVVDGDMSDGKVSFRVSGGNFGGTVEGNVLLKDAEREGLVNGTISEVVAPEGVETSVNGETLTLSELKPGETASYLITFEVLPDAATYTNIATIESDTLKPGDGDVQENEGLDADEDQKDRVSLEKPAEPETPADPTDPAEPGTPAEGEPGTPADGGTTDSGDTVVKGETARTGDEATISPAAKGIGLGVVGGLLVGLVAWFNRTRIAQLFKREG